MNNFRKADDLSRRTFLHGAAGSLLGVSFLNSLNAANAKTVSAATGGKAKRCIYLYMSGGMSHIDSFDVKPGNTAIMGNTKAIKTNADGVMISNYFPNMANQMNKVAVINSLTTTQGAHRQGNYYMHTSYPERGTIKHPHTGAWVSKMKEPLNDTLPSYVKIGGGNGSLGGGFFSAKHAALPIGDPKLGLQYSTLPRNVDQDEFHSRLDLLNQMNRDFAAKSASTLAKSYQQAYDDAVKLMGSKDLETFDINKESEEVRKAYGDNSFGQGVLLARRLVEKGSRYVEVNLGGWDHHNDIDTRFKEKSEVLDQALAALLNDLGQRGLLDETLVVVATEFGRTPRINQNKGRDHFPKSFSCLLAGGGIRGGRTYGKTDKDGTNIIENKVAVTSFNATIAHALGVSTDTTLHSPEGRPFKVAHKGKPIMDLF